MVALRVPRRQLLWVGIGALIVLLIAVVVLMRLSSPSSGKVVDGDTAQSIRVEHSWQEKLRYADLCLDVDLAGDISGNARPTWGFTGPITVWENLRLHNVDFSVTARTLDETGECGSHARVSKIGAGLVRKNDDGWVAVRGSRHTARDVYEAGSVGAFGGRLDGGAYDRGESYDAEIGVWIEPHWRTGGGTASDSVQVTHTFEVPVPD